MFLHIFGLRFVILIAWYGVVLVRSCALIEMHAAHVVLGAHVFEH